MKKPKKRAHRFVVGYNYEGACLYGKVPGRKIREDWTVAHPMTRWQAKTMLSDLSPRGAIYELVEVKGTRK